jgi:nucleoid DNA-binding protein
VFQVKKAVRFMATTPRAQKSSSTSRKGAGAKSSEKAAPTGKPVAATLDVVPASSPAPEPVAQLKKKELIERVVAAMGGKKKGVREIVEATLTILGDALDKGEGLNLPPFGKARIAKQGGTGSDAAMTLKVRRGTAEKKPGKGAKDALAEDGEDS